MALVAGEHGKTLRIHCGFDLSGVSNKTLTVRRPDGSTFSVASDDIVVGGEDAVTKKGNILTAGEYVTTLTQPDQYILEGRYKMNLVVDFGEDKRLKSITRILDVEA